MVFFYHALRKRIGHSFMQGLGTTVLKTVSATILMAAVSGVILYLMRDLAKGEAGLKFDILRLAAVVCSSIVIYYYSSVLLRNDGLSLIVQRKKSDK